MGRTRQIAGIRAKNFKPPRLTSGPTNGMKKDTQNFLLYLCDRGKIQTKVYRKYILEKSKGGFDSRKWMDNLYQEGEIKKEDYDLMDNLYQKGEIKKEDYERYSSSEDEEESVVYKFRAECAHDARVFGEKANVKVDMFDIKENSMVTRNGCTVTFDVVGTFSSNKSHDELLSIAWSITDCHVLAGTLQPEDKYTGDRTNNPPEEKVDHEPVHSGPELPVSNEETSMNEQEDSKSKLSPSEKERIQLALNKTRTYDD